MSDAPLMLFNSLTRSLEPFVPVHPGEARVYTCGPTVYNYQHIGNMRAYVFADTLGRTLQWKGYKLSHVINITDVGHLTSDADEGEDKMEKMAASEGKSAWDIARLYQEDFERDLDRLNVQPKQHPRATEFVEAMIAWGAKIAEKHCYELESGLYFDTSSVADYGRLAREDDLMSELMKVSSRLRSLKGAGGPDALKSEFVSISQDFLATLRQLHSRKALQKYRDLIEIWKWADTPGSVDLTPKLLVSVDATRERLREGRIESVEGKRNEEDFAIWRKTPAGETRQMEWDSPWGRGAPGWHLECSVMGEALLGFPFDIHTGGIDHREIHHPNEIAQNQAFCGCGGLSEATNSGAKIWMHNNFLVERSGKMSKSSGEFLRLQLLVDKGYHPLAYRMMCLQSHYRSELEFSWEGLQAALTRLKRILWYIETWNRNNEGSEVVIREDRYEGLTVERIEGLREFETAISDDLNTPRALVAFEHAIGAKGKGSMWAGEALRVAFTMDDVLGLGIRNLTRADLRIRPKSAAITEAEVEDALTRRKEARAAKDFATSDAIRDELAAKGVEIMDGDPLGWEWKLG